MLRSTIDAYVYFRHTREEVAELSRAIIPLAPHIRAVSSSSERGKLNRILECRDFRSRDAATVTNMLKRAANHARINLDDYFPLMHQDILEAAERLEEAVKWYLEMFRHEQLEAIPVH